jgi:hypothetical protein
MTRHLVLGSTMMLLLAAATAKAQYTVTVYPSIGPNGNGSPSITTYGLNAISALETGATHAGTPGTPGYYSQLPSGSTVSPTSIISTGANSWLGNAHPTGAFANEVGNALFFGVSIKSTNGSPFTPTTLNYNLTTGVTNPGFNAALTGNLATRTYSPFLVGFNGATQIPTGTPVAGTPVTAIYWAGPSGSFASTVAGLPAAIQSLLAQYTANGGVPVGGTLPGNSFNINGTAVSLNNNARIGTPEPASVAVLALGVMGLLGYTYNRRRRAAPLSAAC